MAMLVMTARQQCSAPPGRLAQLSPPHWPHDLSQQTTLSCARKPLAHQVEVALAAATSAALAATISSAVVGSVALDALDAWSEAPSSLLAPVSRGSSVSPRPVLLFSAGGFFTDTGPPVTAAAAYMADAAAALLAAIVASKLLTVEPEGAVV